MNRPKISIFIAQSLDGYIARRDGDLDWLNAEASGDDYGYSVFVNSVDVIIIGRNTFDKCMSFDSWPYSGTKVIVLTTKELILPEELTNDVEVKNCSPHDVVSYVYDSGIKHIYVDGGLTIQSFLDADTVDQLIITTIPVLLGNGIPLFGPLKYDLKLRHVATKSYANGLVQTTYETSEHS